MSKCKRCHKEDGECIAGYEHVFEETKLKPCPFCGGKAKLHTDGITAISCINCGMFVNNEERSIDRKRGREEKVSASLLPWLRAS